MNTKYIRKGLAAAAAALLVAAAPAARAEYDSASRWIWGAAEAHSHETNSFRGTFTVPGSVKKASIKVHQGGQDRQGRVERGTRDLRAL